MPVAGSIALAGAGTDPNTVFYRGTQIKDLFHRNGDVAYSLAGRAII